jgi:hypothetical protein
MGDVNRERRSNPGTNLAPSDQLATKAPEIVRPRDGIIALFFFLFHWCQLDAAYLATGSTEISQTDKAAAPAIGASGASRRTKFRPLHPQTFFPCSSLCLHIPLAFQGLKYDFIFGFGPKGLLTRVNFEVVDFEAL